MTKAKREMENKSGRIGLPQAVITWHNQGGGKQEQGANCSIGGQGEKGVGEFPGVKDE